jgi:hypothetical protein
MPSGFLQDALNITDSFLPNPPEEISDTLILQDIYTFENDHNFSHVQTLIESYTHSLLTKRTLSDIGVITQGFIVGTIVTLPPETTNTPPGTTFPPTVGPFNQGVNKYAEKTVSFTFSNGTLSATIVMVAPEFGNTVTFEPKEINEDTRGLNLIQYHDVIWPEEELHELTFTKLSATEADSIRLFLRQSVGCVILYTDPYGNSHTVFIVDPEAIVTSTALGYSVKFSLLEGVPA